MKTRFLLLICLSIATCCQAQSQTSSKVKSFTIDNKIVVSSSSLYNQLDPGLKYRLLPKPNPGADKAVVAGVKESLSVYRDKRNVSAPLKTAMVADAPVMLRNFIGNAFNFFVPNDNDMAISNHDEVCSVTNTTIWSRDQVNAITYGSFNLHTITDTLGLDQEEFDPKVLYDPVSDRFIVVCLNGFTDSTSNILVGFSQDSSSHGNWNFYSLPGDPLNNNLWTDFPMISVSNDELFITCNLLYNDSTWQAGFNESVIWQINKNEGYSGAPLNPLLHFDIHHNNEPIRNLCPVKGGSAPYGPHAYFLSNRNFTASNDTIFLVKVVNPLTVPPVAVTVTPTVSNLTYRMPADAPQPVVSDLLIVNDARILGAFHENNKIQFVFNTLDTNSGRDGIYHGVIDITGTPVTTATLYVNDSLDLAYPNISYAGLNNTDDRAVMSVLYSSPANHPGSAAFQCDGTGNYSPVTIVKEGLGYTNMINGNERWGDYTGCQTRYNMPGYVWMSGSYSMINHTTRTWIAELATTNTSLVNIADESENINVYPNPSDNKFTVQFEKPDDGHITIVLADNVGKSIVKLFSGSIRKGPNEFSFNPAPLAKGIYYLNIIDRKNKILSEKIVIN